MKKSIFVLGDLVIDHVVFVESPKGPHTPAAGETVNVVKRRQDIAGGAANSARALAVMNEGTTYLWGVFGRSHWGTFRQILESSHLLDGVDDGVQLRGVHDETDAQMNTITRILELQNDGSYRRSMRLDDVNHVHVSENRKLDSILYSLNRIQDSKNQIDAILINDLDKGSLTKRIVTEIYTEFAAKYSIPIFVDPKRTRETYCDIQGEAIFPNLLEWCHLVGDPDINNRMRANIDNRDTLNEMAQRSFRKLGNFKNHIIKCDNLGSVIIAPHPETSHKYAIYRVPPVDSENTSISPLGAGDVMAANMIANYEVEKGTRSLLTAFNKGNVAVACYREMEWHRMPSKKMVTNHRQYDDTFDVKPIIQSSIGMLYLPSSKHISLSQYKTSIPSYFSRDKKCIDLIDDLFRYLTSPKARHVLLAAPSGEGKGVLVDSFEKMSSSLNIETNKITSQFSDWEAWETNPSGFLTDVLGVKKDSRPQLFVIDEAWSLKKLLKDSKGFLIMLDDALQHNCRFWLIDSAFCQDHDSTAYDQIMKDIRSRFDKVEIPPFTRRPHDIAIAVASKFYSLAKKAGHKKIEVEGKVMLAALNYMFQSDSRDVFKALEEAFFTASGNSKEGVIRINEGNTKFASDPAIAKRNLVKDVYCIQE